MAPSAPALSEKMITSLPLIFSAKEETPESMLQSAKRQQAGRGCCGTQRDAEYLQTHDLVVPPREERLYELPRRFKFHVAKVSL